MTLKITCTVAFLTAAFCLPATQAEEAAPKPIPTPPAGGQQMGGMDMSGMMMSEDKLKGKQEHLLKMHELSNKILAATDPKEKDRLKAEQLQLMKDHEKQHHQMMQQHMQDMMKQKGGMPGMSGGAMPGMQHGGPAAGGMGNMPGMQHGNTAPAAPAAQPAPPR
ncbi:MAG: hypothetical protein LUO80_00750 [Methylococcaceae bacterium]|jgi:hypothetical protein|nr:hypothetical protein [Methylococcaceae bacterium]